ncbi:NHL repeat-containing protein [Flavobacterium sp.]|uniref:NHL repeat-containing protein n=1 Tax=Flavobacterium sp. TaxID=239 RepID=UPI00286E53AF|nr:NHL repeat-containing protein [Flavobacterium sp.]
MEKNFLKLVIFSFSIIVSSSCNKSDTPQQILSPKQETQQVSTLAGSTQGFADGSGATAQFSSPTGVAIDASGNVYVADTGSHKIRKISPAGVVTTLAGSTQGFADGTSTTAQFDTPNGVAVDAFGNVYVADTENQKIRKISPTGSVTTLAGSTLGFAEGTSTVAQFHLPYSLAVDANGNVFVADIGNDRIRKINPFGVVTTFAGGTQGFADGTGTSAQFDRPFSVALDASGNMYVADRNNNKIRKISPGAVVTTLAGSTLGFADGSSATSRFYFPHGVAVDASGNVYVADRDNHSIRKISPTGVVSTLAGGTRGFADGIGTASQFDYPSSVAVDNSGNVYVADQFNNKIRKIIKN